MYVLEDYFPSEPSLGLHSRYVYELVHITKLTELWKLLPRIEDEKDSLQRRFSSSFYHNPGHHTVKGLSSVFPLH